MKKFLKVLGIIILVLAVIIAGIAAYNWMYVRAVNDGLRYADAQLVEKQKKNTEEHISSVNEKVTVELRELTEEEKAQIASGELSQTALMAQILSEAVGAPLPSAEESTSPDETAAPPVQEAQPSVQTPEVQTPEVQTPAQQKPAEQAPVQQPAQQTPVQQPVQQPAQQTEAQKPAEQPAQADTATAPQTEQQPSVSSDQLIAEAVGKLYNLQAQYTSQLDSLVSRAKSYYVEERKAGNSAASVKSAAAAKFSGEVTAMESACDAKVNAVVNDLRSKLTAIGADTSITSTLLSAYENEKAVQRAAYVNKYMK